MDDDDRYHAETAASYLDKEGVDPRFYSEPFLEASELGDAVSLKQKLVQASEDERRKLVRSVDQQGRTALLLTCKKGDAEMAKLLLDNGALVNDTDTSGISAMHYAAARGSASIIDALLSLSANAEAKDDSQTTPLMWARGGRVATLLVAARADVHATNALGQNALMFASQTGDCERIQALADSAELNLDLKDVHGCSAHSMAIENFHDDAAELLVSLGATATLVAAPRIVQQAEALFEILRQGNVEACDKFFGAGCSIDLETEIGGETALLLASGSACIGAVKILLREQADPNHADAFLCETPLHRAILSKSSNEMLWMLLEAKADPSRQDLAGRAPADVAMSWGSDESADILKAASLGELSFGTMD